ncbi:hypothetical protein DUQ06_20885 [Salmonella enterica subsp. diarizonae]|nr:hypothetical protein [Salmonella enterica subsp. diarizonae]
MQKSQNGADILDTALFRQSIGVYDASTSQKGLVRLNGGVSDADDTLGATSGAVKIAYDAAFVTLDGLANFDFFAAAEHFAHVVLRGKLADFLQEADVYILQQRVGLAV